MGLHRRELSLTSGVRRMRGPTGVPGTAPAADKHNIVSVTNSGGNAKVTTAAAHGLSAGAFVVVTGTAVYDRVFSVASVPSSTTFLLGDDGGSPFAFISPTSGGQWATAISRAFTSAADDGSGNVLLTTSSTAGLFPGRSVMVTDSVNYNGTYQVLAVVSGTTFSIDQSFVSDDSGNWHS